MKTLNINETQLVNGAGLQEAITIGADIAVYAIDFSAKSGAYLATGLLGSSFASVGALWGLAVLGGFIGSLCVDETSQGPAAAFLRALSPKTIFG